MTNNIQTDGLVIKQADYKEADRMLTLFTPEYGIIQAAARGVRKMKSGRSASAQLFCYSSFELYTGGDIAVLNNVTMKDAFFPISEDIEKLSLFTYFSDAVMAALGEHNPDSDTLSLFLNSLYAAAYKKVDLLKIKPVFEIRLMRNCGFFPDILHCSRCLKKEGLAYFSARDALVCGECRQKSDMPLSPDSYACLYYILYSMPKKIYSFNAPKEVFCELSELSEKYLIYHLERAFPTLEYYKKICRH
jgi:DNA repair protein RecO (recombination protein O)